MSAHRVLELFACEGWTLLGGGPDHRDAHTLHNALTCSLLCWPGLADVRLIALVQPSLDPGREHPSDCTRPDASKPLTLGHPARPNTDEPRNKRNRSRATAIRVVSLAIADVHCCRPTGGWAGTLTGVATTLMACS
jgi:hypothetical protein